MLTHLQTYSNRMSLNIFTTICHWILYWTGLIRFTYSRIIVVRFSSKSCLIYGQASKFISFLQILVLEFCILSSSLLCRLHAAPLSFVLLCSRSFTAKCKAESHFVFTSDLHKERVNIVASVSIVTGSHYFCEVLFQSDPL
jgi:hypothetical protein